MRITIDSKKETISIEGPITIGELGELLEKHLPEARADWIIEQTPCRTRGINLDCCSSKNGTLPLNQYINGKL